MVVAEFKVVRKRKTPAIPVRKQLQYLQFAVGIVQSDCGSFLNRSEPIEDRLPNWSHLTLYLGILDFSEKLNFDCE